MLLIFISTNSETCCGSPTHDKPESKLKSNNSTRREIICYFKEKKSGRKGNAPDSFKLLSKTLTYFEAGNRLQIHSGNSPDRVWKKGDFWEKCVSLHFSSPTGHIPVFHNSTDTPQLAQLPLDLPILHRLEAMGTWHAGLQTCPTGGLSIRTFFSPKKVPKCLVLHSHRDRSWCLTDLLGHCCSSSASDTSRAREESQRNRNPMVAQKPGKEKHKEQNKDP